MPITEILQKNADFYPNDLSLVEINPRLDNKTKMTWREYSLIVTDPTQAYRREMTWGEFNKTANRFANLLLTRGIKKGDKVAILMMNCIEWLPVYFGVLKTGAVVVPLNYRYTADEIKYCINKADADFIVFGPEFTGRIEEICDRVPRVKMWLYCGEDCPTFADSLDELISYCSSKSPKIQLTDNDDAAIYYSSGTTGFPKAILHSHKALMHACMTEQAHHSQTKDDVFLLIPPLYHTGAKMHWFGSFLVGAKSVILKGIKPEWIINTASEEKCSIVWLLVPWAQDILDSLDNGSVKKEDYCLDQWRLMHIGAQPVPPSMIKHWMDYFPNHQYDTNYGLSESLGPGCVHLGVENIHKVGAIGKPGYMWECRIVDENRKDVAPGDVGELAVKGPGVMVCYYNNPEATKEVLDDERWLYTGDMAIQDEDGFIFLVDRKKDVIISGGENLYPVQIEDFLHTFEPINDVAVIGLPDKRLGEIATAIIQLKEGFTCTEQDVNDYCKKLPRYKRPRKIIFAEVPRNPTGKIEKPKLREQYGAAFLVASENEVKQ